MEDCLEVLGEVYGVILTTVILVFLLAPSLGYPLIGNGFLGVCFGDVTGYDGVTNECRTAAPGSSF